MFFFLAYVLCFIFFSGHPHAPKLQIERVENVPCKDKHVTLTCNTTVGNPADTTFTFYRNNQVVKSVSGILNGKVAMATVTIALITGKNSFKCAANNSVQSLRNSAVKDITAEGKTDICN